MANIGFRFGHAVQDGPVILQVCASLSLSTFE